MPNTENSERQATLNAIAAILRKFDVRTNEAEASLAQRWLDAGFDDAEEIGDWLLARCLTPEDALQIERAGITPTQAATRTRLGADGEEDTIAHKILQGSLSLEEARRIITSDFWGG